MSEEQKTKIRNSLMKTRETNPVQSRRWITDGIENRRMLPNEPIPQGWRIGRTK